MRYQRTTSWDEIGFVEVPGGARHSSVSIAEGDGGPDDPIIHMIEFPPNFEVPPHAHKVDYCEIIVKGTQCVTRKWHKAGDIRIVKAGTTYGPLVAGEDGCTVLVIFKTGDWRQIPPGASPDEG